MILIEGTANVAVLVLKVGVGLWTGSFAVLSDALHSLSDAANNAVAWFVARLSAEPPDEDHPYGHRKFETLAVFGLATLLTVLAFEIALGALRRESVEIRHDPAALALMLGVLAINTTLAAWERRWARRLDSDLLRADAQHTFSDVVTSIAVIVGWQLGARGHPWLDTACALGVAALVLYLAYGLFRSAIPVLVDRAVLEPERISNVAGRVIGVGEVGQVRSRSTGRGAAVDLTIRVDPDLPTSEAHEIADRVEAILAAHLGVGDVTVHVEPTE